jgi:hypothetical protein
VQRLVALEVVGHGRATEGASSAAVSSTPAQASDVPALPDGWVADELSVPTNLGTVWGTWTHPRDDTQAVPAALIIGGSGPTDREGNIAHLSVTIDNLAAVAAWLAADGVATLRTDKPGRARPAPATSPPHRRRRSPSTTTSR